MTEDKLAFLDAAPSTEPAKPAEPMATPPVQEPAPVQAKPQEPPSTPPAPPPVSVEPPRQEAAHTVPLPKYLDVYNEARELKRQNAEMLRQMNEAKAQTPDLITDPDAYNAHLQKQFDAMRQQFQAELGNSRYGWSEALARQQYGDKVVQDAIDALAQNPAMFSMFKNAQSPAHEVVKWHKQQQLLGRIGDPDKLDEFVKSEYAKLLQQTSPGVGAQPMPSMTPQAPPVPPPSLSNAPAAPKASDAMSGPGIAFDATFNR
jgi:hypothetical protein